MLVVESVPPLLRLESSSRFGQSSSLWGVGPLTCNATASTVAFVNTVHSALGAAFSHDQVDAENWKRLLVHLASWWDLLADGIQPVIKACKPNQGDGCSMFVQCSFCVASLRLALLAWGNIQVPQVNMAMSAPLFAGPVSDYLPRMLSTSWPVIPLLNIVKRRGGGEPPGGDCLRAFDGASLQLGQFSSAEAFCGGHLTLGMLLAFEWEKHVVNALRGSMPPVGWSAFDGPAAAGDVILSGTAGADFLRCAVDLGGHANSERSSCVCCRGVLSGEAVTEELVPHGDILQTTSLSSGIEEDVSTIHTTRLDSMCCEICVLADHCDGWVRLGNQCTLLKGIAGFIPRPKYRGAVRGPLLGPGMVVTRLLYCLTRMNGISTVWEWFLGPGGLARALLAGLAAQRGTLVTFEHDRKRARSAAQRLQKAIAHRFYYFEQLHDSSNWSSVKKKLITIALPDATNPYVIQELCRRQLHPELLVVDAPSSVALEWATLSKFCGIDLLRFVVVCSANIRRANSWLLAFLEDQLGWNVIARGGMLVGRRHGWPYREYIVLAAPTKTRFTVPLVAST